MRGAGHARGSRGASVVGMNRRVLCLGLVMMAVAANAAQTARSEARERPLMRDFAGLNSHADGHSTHGGFRPELYRPTASLLREYHWLKRDLGDNPAEPAPLPRGKDGTDWAAVYESWTAKGWRIDACLQFEAVEPGEWNDIESEARAYGRAFAREFGPSGARKLVEAVEIGNEPTRWSDEDYARMFRALAQGVREGDPRMRIVTSNVTVGPSGKWDKSVDLVAAYPELYDVLGLHIYAEVAQDPTWERSYPENPKLLRYLNDIAALCRWRDEHAPEKAVWVTEFGYDSSTKTADPEGKMPEWVGVTDEQQAQWLVRSLLMFAAMPVERAYIYFFNDRDRPSLHASAGITRNFRPKPSFHALAHLQRVLGDYRFRRVVSEEAGALRVHEFERGDEAGRTVWAVWSPTGDGSVTRRTLRDVPGKLVGAERMPLTNGGEETAAVAVQRADGAIEVEAGESPTYLVFNNTNMTNSASNKSAARREWRASEVNAWLRSLHPVPEPSVDRVIAGDPETRVKGIAVMWTPTWAALREAQASGCNVLVAHEPTFFSHLDLDGFEEAAAKISPAALKAMRATRDAKLKWIQENGMVVIRCHDVLDLIPGGVADSLAQKLGFGEADVWVNEPYYRVVRVAPAMQAIDLAERMAKVFGTIGQPGVAFYGDPERRVEKLGLGTGYACEPWRFVELGADMCLTIDDRIKTWIETEWADDAGYPMVVIHHGTSEEWGVHTLHGMLAKQFPELPVRLIAQGFRARWVSP